MQYQKGIAWVQYHLFPHNFFFFFFTFCSLLLFYPSELQPIGIAWDLNPGWREKNSVNLCGLF